MTGETQPDSEAEAIDAGAHDWLQQFLKHFELSYIDSVQKVASDAALTEYGFVAVRAFTQTLLESGLELDQIREMFGRVTYFTSGEGNETEWTPELNTRRFELIDRDIQGTIDHNEMLELARLTQLMRAHIDSDVNLPFAGAKTLHQRLSELDSESKGLDSDL